MQRFVIVTGLLLLAVVSGYAKEQDTATTTTAAESPQVAQIEKQLGELKARKGKNRFILTILDSTSDVTKDVIIPGKAEAEIAISAEKGKPIYKMEIMDMLPASKSKTLLDLGFVAPSSWTLATAFKDDPFFASYSIPASKAADREIARFIVDLFVKLYKVPASDTLKFSIQPLM